MRTREWKESTSILLETSISNYTQPHGLQVSHQDTIDDLRAEVAHLRKLLVVYRGLLDELKNLSMSPVATKSMLTGAEKRMLWGGLKNEYEQG